MKIKIFTTGGTIDKVYFDSKSEYQVGTPKIDTILKEMTAHLEYDWESVLRKDSIDMTDDDRQRIFDKVFSDKNEHIIITHGTDTMIETAKKLKGISGKVIVLTGAIAPAEFKSTDAVFNVGSAVAAVQTLPHGIYIVMNGRIFDPDKVRKNRKLNRFDER